MNPTVQAFLDLFDRTKVHGSRRTTVRISLPPAVIDLGQPFRRRRVEVRKMQVRLQRKRIAARPRPLLRAQLVVHMSRGVGLSYLKAA